MSTDEVEGPVCEADSETFKREALRIRFRRALMALPGGTAWLLHVARLFEFRERLLGPGDFGMPTRLRVLMFRHGW